MDSESIFKKINAELKSENRNEDKLLDLYTELINTKEESYMITMLQNRASSFYYYKNDFNKAMEDYKKALEFSIKKNEYANTIEIYNEIGVIYFDLKNYNKAITEFNNALKTYNSLFESERNNASLQHQIFITYLSLGDIHFNTGNYLLALENYNRGEIDYRFSENLFIRRGLCYLKLNHLDLAIKEFDRTIELFCKTTKKIQRGSSEDIEVEVKRKNLDQIVIDILSSKGGKTIIILSPVVIGRKGHYREFFEEIRNDKVYTKVRVDNEVKEIVPNMRLERFKKHNIEIIIDRVVVNKNSEKRIYNSLKTALRQSQGIVIVSDGTEDTLYTEKLSDSAEKYTDLFSRGYSYLFLEKYELAIKDFDLAIELNQYFIPAYFFRGLSYLFLNKNNLYTKNLNRIVSYFPEYKDKYNSNEIIFVEKFFPYSARKFFFRGLINFNNGKYTEAIQDNNTAIEIDSKLTIAYYNCVLSHLKLENNEEALLVMNKLVELESENAYFYQLRGIVFYKSSKYTQSLIDFDSAININKNDPVLYFNRAFVNLKLSNHDKVCSDFEKVISLDPNYLKIIRTICKKESIPLPFLKRQ